MARGPSVHSESIGRVFASGRRDGDLGQGGGEIACAQSAEGGSAPTATGVGFVAFAALLVLQGCGVIGRSSSQEQPNPESELSVKALSQAGPQQVVLSFPAGVGRDSVAVAANGALRLADRAVAKKTDGRAAGVSNAGNSETNIGADASTGDLTSVASITLRERARVNGNLKTAGTLVRQNGTTVTGTITQHANLTPLSTFSWSVTWPATNSGDVVLQPDSKRTLAPGSYGSVTVYSRATLSLSAGVYFVSSLSVEPQAKLALNKSKGPIIIYAKTSTAFKGQIVNGGGPEGNFLLVHMGSPAVFVESSFVGTIVAPSASLTLASASHRGTFFAKDVELRPDAVVVSVSFPFDSMVSCQALELATLLKGCKYRCLMAGAGSLTVAQCVSACTAQTTLLQAKAKTTCDSDPDRDGVLGPMDLCPDTPSHVHVNQNGCTDSDSDIIDDPHDQCPGTAIGTPVNSRGCPVATACTEGLCGAAQPTCVDDTCKEVAIATTVPQNVRDTMVGEVLATGTHPVNCKGDVAPPFAPTLTAPAKNFTPIELSAVNGNAMGAVTVTLKSGKVVDGDKVPLNFAWSPVSDPCGPVLYSVFLEYYHCHSVNGVTELASYVNAGWCEWQPYFYQTLSATSLQVNFEIGRVLHEMHMPFVSNLGWQVPTDGAFLVLYQPQWVRLRVYAHDGNGNTSPVDNESHYYVIYSKDLAVGTLTDVPMSPFH